MFYVVEAAACFALVLCFLRACYIHTSKRQLLSSHVLFFLHAELHEMQTHPCIRKVVSLKETMYFRMTHLGCTPLKSDCGLTRKDNQYSKHGVCVQTGSWAK